MSNIKHKIICPHCNTDQGDPIGALGDITVEVVSKCNTCEEVFTTIIVNDKITNPDKQSTKGK